MRMAVKAVEISGNTMIKKKSAAGADKIFSKPSGSIQ